MMTPSQAPRSILLIRPCCIGDVVLATAVVVALRRAYPDARIGWAVGAWSRGVLEGHPMIDALHDTGAQALPVKSARGFLHMTRLLRQHPYDWVLSLVRSPLMSASVMLARVNFSAGLHSGWRGFGYHLRVPIKPDEPRHEADIYLDVVRALGVDTQDCHAYIPVSAEAQAQVEALLMQHHIDDAPLLVVNPAGGDNPGMRMASKRYPAPQLASITDALADELGAHVVLIGGAQDGTHIDALQAQLCHRATPFVGVLSFAQIGALALRSLLYIGNDTGVTHLASATGARTVMLMGPSDPRRYAPYAPHSIALWRDVALKAGGVAYADVGFDWERDGIAPDEALTRIRAFLQSEGIGGAG